MEAFFVPIDSTITEGDFEREALFHRIEKHTAKCFPDLGAAKIALFGICETRGTPIKRIDFGEIRKEFYRLQAGDWDISTVDLGDILAGETLADTYFAIKQIVRHLIKNHTTPLLLGGAHHLTYANYRAYDTLEQFVNMAVIDKKLDLYEGDSPQNFIPKIIGEPPTRLFDFGLIGFQQYFVSTEAQRMMDALHFEGVRLGKTRRAPLEAEPLIRNADVVSIDLSVASLHTAPGCIGATTNGMDGTTLCQLSRFAGLSHRVSSFGIYDYAPHLDFRNATAQLVAEMLWHFVEGFSLRRLEYPHIGREALVKYHVPIEGKSLVFYKNEETDRWWMQIDMPDKVNPQHYLTPCSYGDYLEATRDNIPDKWWRYYQKLL